MKPPGKERTSDDRSFSNRLHVNCSYLIFIKKPSISTLFILQKPYLDFSFVPYQRCNVRQLTFVSRRIDCLNCGRRNDHVLLNLRNRIGLNLTLSLFTLLANVTCLCCDLQKRSFIKSGLSVCPTSVPANRLSQFPRCNGYQGMVGWAVSLCIDRCFCPILTQP